LTCCLTAHAATKVGDEVLGVRFGATLEDVKRAHPGGAVVDDFYTVRNFSPTFATVAFGFTRTGRLCRVNRWYADAYVKQLARGDLVQGLKELTSLLLEEYGPSQPMHKSGGGTSRDPLVISVVWNHEPDYLLALKIVGCEERVQAGLVLVATKIAEEDAQRPGATVDFGFPDWRKDVLGIPFGAAFEEVKRRHPRGVVRENCWIVRNPTAQHSLVCFWFTPARKVYLVSFEYAEEFLKAAGKGSLEDGVQALVAQLAVKFGPCDRMSNGGLGTSEDPKTYVCDWDGDGGDITMQLKIMDDGTSSVILLLESTKVKDLGSQQPARGDGRGRWF
jgi:hypothetical protein